MKNCRIAIRVSTEERQQIENLVEVRKFKNISYVIREALSDFLNKNS